MIGYHYSPVRNMYSILKHGLLVPKRHPKLTVPVTCSEGHRNPHVSLGITPLYAWDLSGGFLWNRSSRGEEWHRLPLLWHLYEVVLPDGIMETHGFMSGSELQVDRDIPKSYVHYVGTRGIDDDGRWIP